MIGSNSIPSYKNIPNPFSHNTLIEYYLLVGNHGQLNIADQRGMIVTSQSLVVGKQQKAVNNNDLSPGTWFYSSVIHGKTVDTKKMIVVR